MINCNQGKAHVQGIDIEIIYDINQIMELMVNNHPEMMFCVITSWANKLSTLDPDTLDKYLFAHYDKMQEDLLKFLKENREDGI